MHIQATLENLKVCRRKFKSHQVKKKKKLSWAYFLLCFFMWFYITEMIILYNCRLFLFPLNNTSISPIRLKKKKTTKNLYKHFKEYKLLFIFSYHWAFKLFQIFFL